VVLGDQVELLGNGRTVEQALEALEGQLRAVGVVSAGVVSRLPPHDIE
jgi:hypothetical protein